MERRSYRITGRVQGVGFRWWTRQTGRQLGVRGTVRNRPDGSVEVHALGRPDRLRELERRLAIGPAGALVDRVDPIDADERELPERFEIQR